jgi:putative salt-induced outer membrane protein YdiY
MKFTHLFSAGAIALSAGLCLGANGPILEDLGNVLQPADAPAAPPPPQTFLDGWTGSVEAGLNGSTGNSEVLNARAAVTGERKTDLMITKASATYVRAQESGTTTKNRFELAARNDWIFEKGSPWRYFITGTYDYDDFQDWQHRITLGNGIGYAFIDDDTTLLVGRAGIGVRREFGGSNDDWTPEGIFGADLSHKLTERQKITASIDYYPSLEDFMDDYRIVTKAAWEVLVDPEIKMSLKVGAEHRYDNTPGPNTKRNDLDYFALLVWSF